jgi:acetyl-CoA synthetase
MARHSFAAAQATLIANLSDFSKACAEFTWPQMREFNWAIDWFDESLANGPNVNAVALRIVGQGAEAVTFREMATCSNRVANGLVRLGL